jgi:hypothetical protein
MGKNMYGLQEINCLNREEVGYYLEASRAEAHLFSSLESISVVGPQSRYAENRFHSVLHIICTDYVYWHNAKELLHQPRDWILPSVFHQGKINLIQNKESSATSRIFNENCDRLSGLLYT